MHSGAPHSADTAEMLGNDESAIKNVQRKKRSICMLQLGDSAGVGHTSQSAEDRVWMEERRVRLCM